MYLMLARDFVKSNSIKKARIKSCTFNTPFGRGMTCYSQVQGEKSQISLTEIFIGHILSKEGLKPDPKKTKAITEGGTYIRTYTVMNIAS